VCLYIGTELLVALNLSGAKRVTQDARVIEAVPFYLKSASGRILPLRGADGRFDHSLQRECPRNPVDGPFPIRLGTS